MQSRLDVIGISFLSMFFQTGSGTSTNMNFNEVAANLANVALGQPLGTKNPVHPNDHVNKGQSSNDVFPSVLHVAAALAILNIYSQSLTPLSPRLRVKQKSFHAIIKVGRTHLMDATPIRWADVLGMRIRSGNVGIVSDRVATSFASCPLGVPRSEQESTPIRNFGRRYANAWGGSCLPLRETANHFAPNLAEMPVSRCLVSLKP